MIEEEKSLINQEKSKNITYIQTIPPNIFLNQDLASQFICPLCKGILYDPVVPCEEDFRAYCKTCIKNI